MTKPRLSQFMTLRASTQQIIDLVLQLAQGSQPSVMFWGIRHLFEIKLSNPLPCSCLIRDFPLFGILLSLRVSSFIKTPSAYLLATILDKIGSGLLMTSCCLLIDTAQKARYCADP